MVGKMKIVSNDVTYYVNVMGEGEPLLFLHGFTGNHETWLEVAKTLSKQYMCIMPDIIGHGNTDHPNRSERYSVEEVSNDLSNILQALNVSKVNLLGYSMGGRLALSFAILKPKNVKTLILESASPGLQDESERNKRILQDTKLADMITDKGIQHFVEYWEKLSLFESQNKLHAEKRKKINKQRLSNNQIGLANSLLGMGTGAQPSWWEQLQLLKMPVLLITGELDKKFCEIAKRMKERIEECEWIILPDVGHAIHVENPEMFGKIVSKFVHKWRV
jgi:2-succinyl-6-hydroxy-2,4-cyclohexadiene-1-carboxylate synthase